MLVQDGRLRPNDQILSISGTSLVGLNNRDALNIVRRILSPEALQVNCAISLAIGRVEEQQEEQLTKHERPKEFGDSSRHNDSYIMATQHGKEKVSLDPKMNRSQSLKALQYLNQQGGDDSVIYKGLLHLFVATVMLHNLCNINHVT